MKNSTTFAHELIRELFSNSYNSLVISFSVINYVVSETSPRERRSLILFYIPVKKTVTSFTGNDGMNNGY